MQQAGDKGDEHGMEPSCHYGPAIILKSMNIWYTLNMNSPDKHSRIAILLSILSGILLGIDIYLMELYEHRYYILLPVVLIFFSVFTFALMRFTARIMSWLTRVKSCRLEIPSALAVASPLLVYVGVFSLPFINLSFDLKVQIPAAIFIFILVNIFTFLSVRRKWITLSLAVLTLCVLVYIGLIKLSQFLSSMGIISQDQVAFTALTGDPPDTGQSPFLVHYAGHTRTGYWLNMNAATEMKLTIPEEGRLSFELGVVYPSKGLAPVSLEVTALDGEGKVHDIMSKYINRERVAWTAYESRPKGLSPGTGKIRFKLYSTVQENDNLKPLVLSNFRMISARELPQKNVIIVLLDALRADALGCYGSMESSTPVIDRLASQGVVFEKAISPCSWTLPTVASILTSRLPSQHGLVSFFWCVHDKKLIMLPEILSRRGILTKLTTGNFAILPSANFCKGLNEFFLPSLSTLFWRGTEFLMNETADWIKSHHTAPFFIYLHTMDPHDPYLAPEPYMFGPKRKHKLEKIKEWILLLYRFPYIYKENDFATDTLNQAEIKKLRQRYLGEVEYVDAQIRVIEEALKQTGCWENTLMIITSDHGEAFQEHKVLRHVGDDLYREVIRVPLILTGGIMEGKNKRIETPVSLLDLYPTILELFNEPVPSNTAGQSLWPIIEHGKGEDRPVFSEYVQPWNHNYHLISVVKGQYHLIKKIPSIDPSAVKFELYRWDEDPLEQNDLTSDKPEKVREMVRSMDEFFENLPGKKAMDITFGDQIHDIQKRLKALGYMK
jgi:arylsulfatase